MTLDIIVPHYHEPESQIADLLKSIDMQQCVNFDDIKVIIVNDGHDVSLSEGFLSGWKFKVDYFEKEHSGVSAARNYGLDRSTADYVMFCDADDMFCDVCGLWVILGRAALEVACGKPALELIWGPFIMGPRDMLDNERPSKEFASRSPDAAMLKGYEFQAFDASQSLDYASTFVHGKAFLRKFLDRYEIRWPDGLDRNEDNCFCKLAVMLASNADTYTKPIYLWRLNERSVSHSPDYLIDSLCDLAKSFTYTAKSLTKYKGTAAAAYSAYGTLFSCFSVIKAYRDYYAFTEGEKRAEAEAKLADSERYLAGILGEFRSLYSQLTEDERYSIATSCEISARGQSYGTVITNASAADFREWLKRIESLADRAK